MLCLSHFKLLLGCNNPLVHDAPAMESTCTTPDPRALHGRPDFGSLIEFLSSLVGRDVHYHPNPGNAGDKTIDIGFFLLAKRAGLNYTRSNDMVVPASTDVILSGGGGSLVSYWRDARDFIDANLHRCKLLVILPHTVNDHEDLLRSLPKHAVIWAREMFSYRYLKATVPHPENIFLSHDMAFALEDLHFEGSMPSRAPQVVQYAFREDFEQHPHRGALPRCNDDLSLTCDGTRGESVEIVQVVTRLIKSVNLSDIIHTDRLHVGIVASILRKEVHLYPGSYYKMRAVYEHSMAHSYERTQLHHGFSNIEALTCEAVTVGEPCQQLHDEEETKRG